MTQAPAGRRVQELDHHAAATYSLMRPLRIGRLRIALERCASSGRPLNFRKVYARRCRPAMAQRVSSGRECRTGRGARKRTAGARASLPVSIFVVPESPSRSRTSGLAPTKVWAGDLPCRGVPARPWVSGGIMVESGESVRAAVVQAAPIAFDVDATLAKVERLTGECAVDGAQLVVFPEAFVSCYPRGLTFGALVGSRTPEG